jgi:anion-transporting  ArsA/GET3 family ATPase
VLGGFLDRRLVVVTGKGGVGKSTVAAALGLAAARRGARTIVVELAGRNDVRRALTGTASGSLYVERRLAPRLAHISIDARHAVIEYVRRQLPAPAAALLLAGGTFELLAAATPGLAELVSIGKAWALTERHDLVVLDAPATGHALALLRAPATFAGAAHTGPINTQSRAIDDFVRDRSRTAIVLVSAPEELAVTETVEFEHGLRATLRRPVDQVVVNGVLPDRFSAIEERMLEAAPASPPVIAAQFAITRARRQGRELGRLRAALDDVPMITLPFLFEAELRLPALQRLARVWSEPLDGRLRRPPAVREAALSLSQQPS